MVDQQNQRPPQTPLNVGVDGPLAAARRTVLREIEALLTRAREDQAQELMQAVYEAPRIMVLGAGRSKLAVDAFAMRLMHLGLTAHVATDVTCPAVTEGDLLVACSGSGHTPTVVQRAEAAKEAGARIAVVTADLESPLAGLADLHVHLAEYSEDFEPDASTQFVGTLFEQGALVFFDCLILALQRTHHVDPAEMYARHTNLE
ncbi:6-phospho-3-hexuloisomerase [Streptomyces sp. BK208]|uniref:6-phospho-3-hexuloisomerase n=1 Tax=Streptomyces sp. BK208 TaxID=2512150 RepID=UPI00105E856D|nr:6-phospho-3-hexuloisomerase [Streptomyces sp. BK208]TDT39674.1 6-phospho-3-hexuloisomerase [Streptomyces sp. BK208]